MLSQSLAIIEYLDEKHPTPPFLPRDPPSRARVRSMALAIACDIHPLNNLRMLNYLRRPLETGRQRRERLVPPLGLRRLPGSRASGAEHSIGKRYCFGDAVSLADICLVPQMFNARRFDTDLSRFPTLVAISTHLESLPEFAAARPEAQPDAK